MPRPRSDSFYIKLCPTITAVLSIDTKASISAHGPARQSNGPSSPPSPYPLTATTTRKLPVTPLPADNISLPVSSLPQLPAPPKHQPLALSLPHPALGYPPRACLLLPQLARAALPNPHAPLHPSPLRFEVTAHFHPSSLYPSRTTPLFLHQAIHSTFSQDQAERQCYPRVSLAPTSLLKRTLKREFNKTEQGLQAQKFKSVRGAWEVERDIERAMMGGYLFSSPSSSSPCSPPSSTSSSSTPFKSTYGSFWSNMGIDIAQPRTAMAIESNAGMCKRVKSSTSLRDEDSIMASFTPRDKETETTESWDDDFEGFCSSGFYDDSDSDSEDEDEDEEDSTSEETLSDEELAEVSDEDHRGAMDVCTDDLDMMIHGWEVVSVS